MNLRDETTTATLDTVPPDSSGVRRFAWHLIGIVLATALAWLLLAAYRQPDFLLDFAGMRLC